MSRTTTLCIYQADAFSATAFGGNPAAVCLIPASLKDSLGDDVFQKIAAEMNLSETAFVFSDTDSFVDESKFGLRWFTPTKEVDLCGHATLATAAVLSLKAGCQAEMITFTTLSGDLRVKRTGETLFQMDLPINPPSLMDDSLKDQHAALLEYICKGLDIVGIQHSARTRKLLIHANMTRDALEALNFDAEKMMSLHTTDQTRGVIITSLSESDDLDFISRYFAPWNGIPEDPVTGSAHTVLFPYWRNVITNSNTTASEAKTVLNARQCSQRGGNLSLTSNGAQGVDERVLITAEAFVIMEGKLYI
eukprot:m.138210 g.138210  ORF g.138210 m.138210 type:complete len:306 (-) comp13627_c0_seq1:158-1075(-)